MASMAMRCNGRREFSIAAPPPRPTPPDRTDSSAPSDISGTSAGEVSRMVPRKETDKAGEDLGFAGWVQAGEVDNVRSALADGGADPSLLNRRDAKGNCALHWAAYFNETTILSMILSDARCDVGATNHRGLTAVHQAAVANATAALDTLLLDSRAASLVDQQNEWGETALHMAAAAGHTGPVERLLDASASVELEDRWGRRPQQVCVQHGERGVASVFAARGLAVSDTTDDLKGNTSGSEHTAATALGAAVTAQFMEHVAHRGLGTETPNPPPPPAAPPPPPAAALLCSGGPPIATQTCTQDLTIAAAKLKKAVPSVAERDHLGVSVPSTKYQTTADGRSALAKLVEHPGPTAAELEAMVSDASINPAGRDAFGWTALHKFASWNAGALCEVLLERLPAADVNAIGGPDGFTPLHAAIDMGAMQTVATLIRHPKTDRSTVDAKQRTASELAQSRGVHLEDLI